MAERLAFGNLRVIGCAVTTDDSCVGLYVGEIGQIVKHTDGVSAVGFCDEVEIIESEVKGDRKFCRIHRRSP